MIEEAASLSEFQDAWSDLMKHYYWYKDNRIFDWNKDNELKAMEDTFGKFEFHFLVAKSKDTSQIAGLLRLSTKGRNATLERWEPAVQDVDSHQDIAITLVEKAIELARQREKPTIQCTIKFPTGTDSAQWHHELFSALGFTDRLGEMTELLLRLPHESFEIPTFDDISLSDSTAYSNEDIARLTVNCFTGTEEDRHIHGPHKSVTDFDRALQVNRNLFKSEECFSPPDFWRFAVHDGHPIGFVGGLIPRRDANPLTGNLTLVGMLPSYRRRGITSMLIHSVMNSLIEINCKYVTVGTPTNNYPAITMYKKLGFIDHSRLTWLVKSLD